MYQGFDHRGIGLAAQRIQTANYIGEVVLQVSVLNHVAIGVHEVIGFPVFDHQDAISTTTMCRFNNELVVIMQQFVDLRSLAH